MQKLHGVGKFFNEWRADPPPEKGNISPKKEISYRKRKSHKKHKKTLLNLRKNISSKELWMANLSIEIIMGDCMKVNTMFLVPGDQSE